MTELTTIGYEGLDPKRFFELLTRCGVEMLVDVRQLPISRKKGFGKAALDNAASKHGLAYRHVPALGCPRDIRHEYRASGDWGAYTIRFKDYLSTQTDAVSEIAKLALKHTVCLLCFEEDFNFCHRTYVAEAVACHFPGGLRISHLTGPIRGRVALIPPALAA